MARIYFWRKVETIPELFDPAGDVDCGEGYECVSSTWRGRESNCPRRKWIRAKIPLIYKSVFIGIFSTRITIFTCGGITEKTL